MHRRRVGTHRLLVISIGRITGLGNVEREHWQAFDIGGHFGYRQKDAPATSWRVDPVIKNESNMRKHF